MQKLSTTAPERRFRSSKWRESIHRHCRDGAGAGAGAESGLSWVGLNAESQSLSHYQPCFQSHSIPRSQLQYNRSLTPTPRHTMTALRIANKVPTLPRTVPFLCKCAGHPWVHRRLPHPDNVTTRSTTTTMTFTSTSMWLVHL
jgi:hypothetical protein